MKVVEGLKRIKLILTLDEWVRGGCCEVVDMFLELCQCQPSSCRGVWFVLALKWREVGDVQRYVLVWGIFILFQKQN